MTRLIDAEALKQDMDRPFWDKWEWDFICESIDNAPTVEVPENAVNCVLTMFGECSYNKTGCSDCEIKEKIRKALENEPKKGKWIEHDRKYCKYGCNICGTLVNEKSPICPTCKAEMEADNETNN